MFISTDIIPNLYLCIFVNLLIYIAILLVAPTIILGILSSFKMKSSNKGNIYLYAFSAGMFLMIGSVGFLQEAFTRMKNNHNLFNSDLEFNIWTAIIIGLSSLIGLSMVILGRFLFVKIVKKSNVNIHNDHAEHSHSDHLISIKDVDNPKAAWLAIIMILSHRIIDGIFIGYSIYSLTLRGIGYRSAIPLLISFNIHIVIEVIIVYYRQIQYGEKKGKAILYNFLTFLLIIPFMFIGAFLGRQFDLTKWVTPALFAMGGSIIVFMSVFELIPEFIHARNQSSKILYTTFSIFALAIVFTVVLLSFHGHVA
ncbi:ZIP family metal transporter [Mycoplasma phocoeninasale]|uniref:ZIP family metal transporter n=1 Tax=Mycoplasma phocoeninasale TaxID=2726117 RepID=A0A858U7B2_9MOLU|nr:ZIP family metal transporter [Mycoplasma phocoeninasale]MBN0970759.1 ZIP family metal transporter [Mycoplasma phocoeninasale]QJG66616.1 ZIP family metal transporter [Mycoplasma phocoeninasale]